MKRRFTVLLFTILTLVACAPLPSAPFEEGSLARYGKGGAGRVSGVAVDSKSPESKPSEVTLVPATDYTKVIESRIQFNFDPLKALDRRLGKYLRRTAPDSAGRFLFAGVPAGDYYVIFCASKETTVYVTMGDGTTTPEGSVDYRFIYGRVSVGEGQSVRFGGWSSP